MIRLSNFFYRLSTGRVALAAFLGFLLFAGTVLPQQARKADVYSNGAGSPDTSRMYSAEELYQLAEAYGAQGRAEYVYARFTFDLIFPAVYLLFLVTSLSWSLAQVFAESNRLRLLNLFPVFGWAFDMLENISAALVFQRFPNPTPIVANLAGMFTFIKWVFVYGSFLILVLACFAALWIYIRSRKK
jgi:hypothetical protein